MDNSSKEVEVFTDSTRNKIEEVAGSNELPPESVMTFLDTLGELPMSQQGQLRMLHTCIQTIDSTVERVAQNNEELRERIFSRCREAVETLVTDLTDSKLSAEDALQKDADWWILGFSGPTRWIPATIRTRFLGEDANCDARMILDTCALYATLVLMGSKPMPKSHETLAKVVYGSHIALQYTVLGSITWSDLHEAVAGDVDWMVRRLDTNNKKLGRLKQRRCMAEIVENVVTNAPIRFRDDTAPADENALPPIPEDAEPFSGKKSGRYDRCQQLVDAWNEHADRIETKDQLHYRAGGDKVRKAVERVLEDVEWPVPTDVQRYATAVQKLINWHNDRT